MTQMGRSFLSRLHFTHESYDTVTSVTQQSDAFVISWPWMTPLPCHYRDDGSHCMCVCVCVCVSPVQYIPPHAQLLLFLAMTIASPLYQNTSHHSREWRRKSLDIAMVTTQTAAVACFCVWVSAHCRRVCKCMWKRKEGAILYLPINRTGQLW